MLKFLLLPAMMAALAFPAATQEIQRLDPALDRLVPAASIGLKKRTPNSFAPKIEVLARMTKAIPGPLLK